MFFSGSTIFLSVLLNCLTQTIAAPTSTTSTTPDFQVVRFAIAAAEKSKTYKVSFEVHDPNPATHASAICKTTFDASAPVASDPNWVTCSDAAASKGHGAEFAFYIEQFKSASNFRLHIQHSYLDKSIGPCVVEEDGTPIYCNVTYFGDRVVSAAKGDLKCDGNTCTNTFSKSPKTIKIPINQAIA